MADSALDSFLNTVSDTTDMAETKKLCPEIDATGATIEKVQIDTGIIGKGEREGQPWFSMTFRWDIDSEEAREELGRDTVIVYGDRIFLSVDENQQIRKDDNPDLAKLLKMFEIDSEGLTNAELFDSFLGQFATVQVTHELVEDKPIARVSKVAPG